MTIVYLRGDGDVALDGWTDHADGTTNIYQAIDETSAGDSDFVQSPAVEVEDSSSATITISSDAGATGILFGGASFPLLAQSFPSAGDTVSTVAAWIKTMGTPTDGVVVKLYTADGSEFPATLLDTSNTVLASSMSGSLALFDFVFPSPVSVTNGVQYVFVLERTGALNASNHYSTLMKDGTYAGGQLAYHNGSVWAHFSANDIVSVVEQGVAAATTNLKVRLVEGSTQIVEWTHTDIADTFADAEQTLTAPQVAAITDFDNLFAELDDTLGNVYRFALSDPSGGVAAPVTVRYRFRKLLSEIEEEVGEESEFEDMILYPTSYEPPSSNYATLDTRNNHPVLDFDTTTAEAAIWTFVLPVAYAGGGLTVEVAFSMESATSGTCGFTVEFERIGDGGQDVDSDSFASAQTITAVTVPATSGWVDVVSVNITSGANMDSIAAGEQGRIRLKRDVANDTAAGDAEVHWVRIIEQ